MRISAKTREQAAMICAIAASGGVAAMSAIYGLRRVTFYSTIAELGEFTEAALDLSIEAWRCSVGRQRRDVLISAEAEALLRTGWSS